MGQSHNQQNVPSTLIQEIAERIDSGCKLTNRDLLAVCGEAGIDVLLTDPHLSHEIAETALNLVVATKYGKPLLSSDQPAVACKEILRPLQERLPTQSWRSSSQIAYQQFSTPAPISYLAAYLLSLSANDTVLEPSCGTGCLAVWAKAAGATVIPNELDPRRRQIARTIGFEPTGHDAKFIDGFLPETIAPNIVLMNPPFSSCGGRVERNQNKFRFRQVESALRRLANGDLLLEALSEIGFTSVRQGKALPPRRVGQTQRPDSRHHNPAKGCERSSPFSRYRFPKNLFRIRCSDRRYGSRSSFGKGLRCQAPKSLSRGRGAKDGREAWRDADQRTDREDDQNQSRIQKE